MLIKQSSKQIVTTKLLLTCLFAAPLSVAQASTSPIDLGAAGQFDAYILGNMSGEKSDVEGRLAVGGNLKLTNYAIGQKLSDSNGTRDDLVVGGKIDFTNGRIYNGNARSGQESTIGNSVGFYNETNLHETNGQYYYTPPTPINFSAINNDLKNKSETWKSLSNTGAIDVSASHEIKLSGNESGLNIFSLTSADLSSATKFWLDIPENAWALINVSGTDVSMHGFAFFWGADGKKQAPDTEIYINNYGSLTQRTLFNFFEAKTLDIHSMAVKGSVLAADAKTDFYNGHIDGHLVVGSLCDDNGQYTCDKHSSNYYTTGQINHISTVPLPPSMALFASGLLGLLIARHWHFMHKAKPASGRSVFNA